MFTGKNLGYLQNHLEKIFFLKLINIPMHHFFFYANQTWPLYLPFSPTSCSFPKKDNMVQNTIIYQYTK